MTNEIGPERHVSQVPEVLKHPHTYGVVMPYAQNIKELGSGIGRNRLTFYSAFNLNASYELYKEGHVKKLILCGETTFGDKKSTTSELMRDALVRKGVPLTDIIVLTQPKLDNTAVQIKALAEYQKRNGLQSEQFLVIDWKFHDERIKSHIRGFGLNAATVQSEDVHKLLHPDFDLTKLTEVLPKDFEEREKPLRKISKIDKRGLFPRLAGIFRGASVTDIKKTRDNEGDLHVDLEDSTGKKKLKELESKYNPYKEIKRLEGEGKLDAVLGKVVERLKAETGILKDFDELGLTDNLTKGFEHASVNGYSVKWGGVAGNLFIDNPSSKKRGHFSPPDGELRVYFKPPTKSAVMDGLVGGYFPGGLYSGLMPLSGLLHEATHTFQFPRGLSAEKNKQVSQEKGKIFEAQAYRTSTRDLNEGDLVEFLRDRYDAKQAGKAGYAIKAVDKLTALGLTIPQIADSLWNSGEWDDTQKAYPDIENTIHVLREEKDINEEELDRLVKENIEKAGEDKLRAQEIVLEELFPDLMKKINAQS